MTTEPTPQLRALGKALEVIGVYQRKLEPRWEEEACRMLLFVLRQEGYDIVTTPPVGAPDAALTPSGYVGSAEVPGAAQEASDGNSPLGAVKPPTFVGAFGLTLPDIDIPMPPLPSDLIRRGEFERFQEQTNACLTRLLNAVEELNRFQRRVEAAFEGLKVREG